MSEQSEALSAAQVAYGEAAEALRREQTLASLRSKPGLAYASIGDGHLGPFLVSNDGDLIGEVRSDQGTGLQGWYAVLYDGDAESEPSGPFGTIRAAAASMIR